MWGVRCLARDRRPLGAEGGGEETIIIHRLGVQRLSARVLPPVCNASVMSTLPGAMTEEACRARHRGFECRFAAYTVDGNTYLFLR